MREGNHLRMTLGSDYSDVTRGRILDQAWSITARDRWTRCVSRGNPDGQFQLFRIRDAVAVRKTHAAIFDAQRLVKDL